MIRIQESQPNSARSQREEAMAVGALLAEELILLAPCGHQRQADDVLIEVARGLEVLRGVGGVMQS